MAGTYITKYKTLYLWMLIPMFFMQFGIFRDYWGDFSDNAMSVHVHYWTGTIWYIYLIIQPYYATHGQMSKHRTNGIIGMFLAGAVCLTALSMMHRDIVSAERSAAMRDQFGPFEPWFFYGIIIVEIVMITAFGYAVIKSIIHRKQIENHAWWLVSSVFIIMMPALARGIGNIQIAIQIDQWPNIEINYGVYIAEGIILAILFLGAWKYDKMRHPATWIAAAVNVFNFFVEPIGRSETVQTILKTLIKG